MLFLSNRTRHMTVAPMNSRGTFYTNALSHSWFIVGSISLVTGLILIVIGVIYEVKDTRYFGIGLISLGTICFLSKLVYFYGKLDICYNNWIYRRRVVPAHNATPQPRPASVISIPIRTKSPELPLRHLPAMPAEAPTCRTTISSIEIHKVIVDSLVKNDTLANNNI